MAKQKRERQFGLTSDKNAFVDAALVAQLTDGGFSRAKVIRSVPGSVSVGARVVVLTWKLAFIFVNACVCDTPMVYNFAKLLLVSAKSVLESRGVFFFVSFPCHSLAIKVSAMGSDARS